MLGGATQAMPLCIVEERQQRRRPLAPVEHQVVQRVFRDAIPAGHVQRELFGSSIQPRLEMQTCTLRKS